MTISDIEKALKILEINKTKKVKGKRKKRKIIYGNNIYGNGKRIKENILISKLTKLYLFDWCNEIDVSDCLITDINEFIDCREYYLDETLKRIRKIE